MGAKACSGGRLYLYALAAAGQAGVEKALKNLRAEIERDMKLMGCRCVDQEACGATVLARALEAAHGGHRVLDFSVAYP